MNEIGLARLQARSRQITAVSRQLKRPAYQSGQYVTRDERSGLRRYATADGGVFLAQYRSSSVPNQFNQFLATAPTLEGVGYADQKPAL